MPHFSHELNQSCVQHIYDSVWWGVNLLFHDYSSGALSGLSVISTGFFLLLFFFVAEVNLVGGAGTFIFQLRNWKGQAPQWPARQQALLSTLLRHLFFKPVQHRVFVLFDPLDVDSGLLYGLFHCPGSRTQVVVSLKTFQLYTHTHTHTKWD